MFKYVTLAAMCCLVPSAATRADEMDDLIIKITRAADDVKSFKAKIKMTMKMERGAVSMENKGEGTIEMLRRDDKALTRSEMTTSTSVAGQTFDQKTLTIFDGEHTYTLTEQFGQKTANKSTANSQTANMTSKSMFEQLKRDNTLKQLATETVNGEPAYGIEATPKRSNEFTGQTHYFFSKRHGMLLKAVTKTPEGEDQVVTEMTDYDINPKLDPARFKFEAPEGVEVRETGKRRP